MRKNIQYFNTIPNKVSVTSKVIIILLVIAMLLSHVNFSIFANNKMKTLMRLFLMKPVIIVIRKK